MNCIGFQKLLRKRNFVHSLTPLQISPACPCIQKERSISLEFEQNVVTQET